MTDFIEVGKASEIADGSMKEIAIQGQNILLAHVGDKFYATANHCPHMGGNLSQGKLEGTVVTCPRHGSQFDLKDGKVVRWVEGAGMMSTMGKALSAIGAAAKTPRPLVTYEVKIEGGNVFIKI